MLSNTRTGSKDFLKIINQLSRREKSSKRIGPVRNDNNLLVYDDHDKSATMNSFFATIGEKVASKFPLSAMDDLSHISRVTPTISDTTLLHEDFSSKLAKINIRKAHGSDGISSREMNIVSKDIGYCIASISKTSYEEGKYPSLWKIGKVKVLHKGGDSADCGNYRPLTMLSIPSKIAESVLCDTIDSHLNEVLHQNQWDYRKGISSESLLLYLTESWKHYMDEGKVIGAIFIDFRKAFDSVCTEILF